LNENLKVLDEIVEDLKKKFPGESLSARVMVNANDFSDQITVYVGDKSFIRNFSWEEASSIGKQALKEDLANGIQAVIETRRIN
jgi:capsular polysaccharide biosynthesis protein